MKKHTLLVDPEAEQESREAYRWYAERNPIAAAAFQRELTAGLRDIVDHPLTYPMFDKPVRRKLLHRFPYGLLYQIVDRHIILVAVMHLHREPAYWRTR